MSKNTMFEKADTPVDILIKQLKATSPGPEQDAVAEKLLQLGQKNPEMKTDILYNLNLMIMRAKDTTVAIACRSSAKILRSGIKQDDISDDALRPLLTILEPHTPPDQQEDFVDLLIAWSETKLHLTEELFHAVTATQEEFGRALECTVEEKLYSVREQQPPDMSYVINVEAALSNLLKNKL